MSRLNLTIDHYVNPWVPRPPWLYLPEHISHFLGRRQKQQDDVPHILVVIWATLGVFAGLTLIAIIGLQIPSFREHNAPVIVGSFGAAAVLEFYAIESPLAQPRSAVISQLLASIIGVGIRKLFELEPAASSHIWLGGCLSCALTTVVMAFTATVHPPAGATALLAVLDESVASQGWFLIPIVLLGSVLMQCVALLLNNVQRRFPMYWWSPEEVGYRWRRDAGLSSSSDPADKTAVCHAVHVEGHMGTEFRSELVVARGGIEIPAGLCVTTDELLVLEGLRQKLQTASHEAGHSCS